MSDYSIAIKIAGELASSFKSSLQGAQKGLAGLAGVAGKIGGATMKAAAAGIGAATTAAVGLGTAAVNVGKEFETAMSQVSATMLLDQGTEEGKAAFQTLEDAAREWKINQKPLHNLHHWLLKHGLLAVNGKMSGN